MRKANAAASKDLERVDMSALTRKKDKVGGQDMSQM